MYCKERSKQRYKSFHEIQKKIQDVHTHYNITGKEIDKEKLTVLLREQQEMCEQKAQNFIFKLQKEKYEQDEKCSAYFFKKAQAQRKKQVIQGLKRENGDVCENNEEILEMARLHCSKLFERENSDIEKGNYFLDCIDKSVPLDLKEKLDEELKLEELYNALKSMKDKKVPGRDGLTKEFYIIFWPLIGHHLLEVFNEIFDCEKMSKSMREGVVSLLYKKDDPMLLANYRPLTMLCVDYKILSKAITNRLATVMPYLVGTDQTSGVAGRRISWNIQLHRDILTYIEDRNLSAICVSLDQQKAFDRVNHSFLMRVLSRFGFGVHFMTWIKILYNNINSRVNVNGNISKEIQQTRGLRQGCPLSALLYVLYAEPLACSIRNNPNIKGVPLPGGEVLKLSQYADDLILYVADDNSLGEALGVLDHFCVASGSKINKKKTQYKFLGKWGLRKDILFGLTLCTGPMNILGISFGHHKDDGFHNWSQKQPGG